MIPSKPTAIFIPKDSFIYGFFSRKQLGVRKSMNLPGVHGQGDSRWSRWMRPLLRDRWVGLRRLRNDRNERDAEGNRLLTARERAHIRLKMAELKEECRVRFDFIKAGRAARVLPSYPDTPTVRRKKHRNKGRNRWRT